MSGAIPEWARGVKRHKAREIHPLEGEVDWHARFLELRERYVKLIQDNIRLRNQLKDGRRVGRPRARHDYDIENDSDTSRASEVAMDQIDGLSHIISNTEW